MDLTSFLTSLGTSFAIFVILMFLFNWLSRKPGNTVIYYPNRILRGLDPWEGGSKTRNPFAWIKEALTSTEQEVISMSGVDTAVYFVFLSTGLSLPLCWEYWFYPALFCYPVLLPVAATDVGDKLSINATSNGTFSDLDKLSMGHLQEKSPRLWAFLIGVYWVSFVTYFMLWKAYKHVSALRANALMSPQVKPEQFAILVRDIPAVPAGQLRKEQVDSYFKTVYPDTFYRSLVVTNNKKVNKIWEELEKCKKKLARAESIYAASKNTGNAEGKRPTNKTGFLEYYTEKINELIPKLETEQKATLREKQENAALVFFTNRVTAASAAQTLHAQIVDKWTVTEAPEPRQVLWPNLKIKFFQRQVRQYVVYIIVALTAEGIPSQSHAIRAASGKYFYFTIFNVFLGVTIGGTLFSTFKTIEKDPNSIVTLLATSLPGNATYFLTFVALKFFVGYGLELSRIVPLIIFHIKRKYLCKTEAELKAAWHPSDLGYGTRVAGDMLIITLSSATLLLPH
ncbi:CSC1-like protein ERD4 [Prunus yedoensis var. nudiflora]|uniref:CSC1-like protein ERD4 n=1 Tax=Prunus yedoensis var. nudiflora TaxID=2094558 RepID=A0A314YW81_PRUYE|nr:CSC1-like protein ERD4 [Prunus yedoensis var. nudiflora]